MTVDLMSLRLLPHRAADYLTEHGWTQGVMETGTGRVCLTGALRECDPQPGDWRLAREVYRHRGRGEGWNDEPGRTQSEVEAELRRDITDADLAETFGPQWLQVVALVRRAATLTEQERRDLDAAWDAVRIVRIAARNAARDAARHVAWTAACGAAARDAAWDAARIAARTAARDAAWALAVRDLIGQHGFTQQQYDTLTAPWRTVIGPLHPEDV